jgi:hypothetical protein
MTVLLESKDEKKSTWRIEMCRETNMVVSSACHGLFVECQQRRRSRLTLLPTSSWRDSVPCWLVPVC